MMLLPTGRGLSADIRISSHFSRHIIGGAHPVARSAVSGAQPDGDLGSQKDEGGDAMLGEHPITPVLLAKDLAATREFYHDRLGLEILTENEDAIVFKCGGGTHLDVTKSTVGTADEQTQASWQVTDIRAEVTDLRARGVKVEDYDMPGLKTEDGIADLGFAWMAWIIDPGKNALAIMQLKD
jgi:catechol 2,3-dioxygenase-like lactoylglutathione lyase family enzyme